MQNFARNWNWNVAATTTTTARTNNNTKNAKRSTHSFSSISMGDAVLSASWSLREIVTRATVCFVFSDSNETFHWSDVAVAPNTLTPDLARALQNDDCIQYAKWCTLVEGKYGIRFKMSIAIRQCVLSALVHGIETAQKKCRGVQGMPIEFVLPSSSSSSNNRSST